MELLRSSGNANLVVQPIMHNAVQPQGVAAGENTETSSMKATGLVVAGTTGNASCTSPPAGQYGWHSVHGSLHAPGWRHVVNLEAGIVKIVWDNAGLGGNMEEEEVVCYMADVESCASKPPGRTGLLRGPANSKRTASATDGGENQLEPARRNSRRFSMQLYGSYPTDLGAFDELHGQRYWGQLAGASKEEGAGRGRNPVERSLHRKAAAASRCWGCGGVEAIGGYHAQLANVRGGSQSQACWHCSSRGEGGKLHSQQGGCTDNHSIW